MSDLSIYELEDIVWDDFERSGDRIVRAHPTDGHDNEDEREGDSCKKPRREVTLLERNEERNIMEDDSWSHIPDGVFADSAKDMPSLQSGDNTKVSNRCLKSSNITTSGRKLCTDEGILKGTSGAVDSNSYNHPQSHIRQSDNHDLNLFSNDGDDKESNDLLYYGWPDIGNSDDMDMMLSNCDSSFGLGVTSNDDKLVWFTSEGPAGGGYEDALKMDLKFPCSKPSAALTNVSQDHESQGSDNMRSSFVSESKDGFKFKDQVLQKEQSRQQNQAEGNIAGSFGLKRNEIQGSSSDEVFTFIGGNQQQHDSFGYTQSSAYLQTTSGSMIIDIKSENNVCFMETSGDPLFQGKNKVHHAHAFQPSFSGNHSQSGIMMLQAENKVESQSDMEGVKKRVSPEGSSISSSELDEISPEATSFRQLHQVMEQLDLRTKLCIRDSLYRLARSAEQRHNFAGGISDSTANCGGTGGPLMTDGTNKFACLMDMETDTNPIDRTIAHLLFHRPRDSNNRPTSLPLRPNAKVPGSIIGRQQGENESDDKISSTRKN